MSRHRDSFDAEVGSGIAGMAVLMGIVLILLLAFLIVAPVSSDSPQSPLQKHFRLATRNIRDIDR